MIEIQHVFKIFGDREVLREVNATIKQGEVFTVIGPSGQGKSTLLRLINLLDTPTSGKILIEGTDIHGQHEMNLAIRRRMGMVFQKPAAFHTTVYENIAMGLRFRGMGEHSVKEHVKNVINEIGLRGYGERRATTLSGGEMQRVALARAMVTEPDILLLDEPTENLDPVSIETIENLILHFNREYGTTVIMATHDMLQGQRLADRIAVMMNGTFSQIGPPPEVFSTPSSEEVGRFVGIDNILSGRVAASRDGLMDVDIDGVTVSAVGSYPAGMEVTLFLRGEDVMLFLSDGAVTSARNTLAGEITEIIRMGAVVRLKTDCGIPISVLITRQSFDDMELHTGKKVLVRFKATSVHAVPLK